MKFSKCSRSFVEGQRRPLKNFIKDLEIWEGDKL